MFKKKELVLPLVLLVILGAVSIYVPLKYMADFLYYRDIRANGINTTAEIVEKGIKRNGVFLQSDNRSVNDRHILKLTYSSQTNGEESCEAVVSKKIYENYLVGDKFKVLYNKKDSNKCFLPENARSLYLLSLIAICFGALFLIIFLASALYVYKSFKKREIPVKLSTRISNTDRILCPECSGEMTEGYIPGVGGINWRERKDPVGLPTMLTGLPGTIFWVKRPILHAFNCKKCSVVIFRYGKNKNN